MIPKIIHLIWWQGYMNIPNKFIKNIDSWKHHNPNYKIIIWDNKSITKFIKKIYPKNYIILNRYFKMIQKIDFSKYLILYYYGGCYVDIDILCNNSLDLFINQDKLNASLFYFTKFRIMPFINGRPATSRRCVCLCVSPCQSLLFVGTFVSASTRVASPV